MALLSLREVSVSFGGPKVLDAVTLQVERGERMCLTGRNGEGKSTLLKLIGGELKADEGDVSRSAGLKIAWLPQEVPEGHGGTVFQEVGSGLDDVDPAHAADDHRVDALLTRMGLDGSLRFSDLSSGMKRRVLLARAIVSEPDILLLDEPTNHLDIDAIRWLENFLLRYPGTLVFVTHDRVLLAKLATRIIELDRGRVFDWSCDYPTFLKRREEMLHAEARQDALFDKRLAQEEVWIRKGVEARRTRNEGRVRSLEAMRVARAKRRERQGSARVQVQESERSGTMVIEAKTAAFSYEGRPIIQALTALIERGDKIGIIGPNGAGKTTLIRLLLGTLDPQSGTVRHGTRLEVAYFDQLKSALDDEKTVQANVSEYEMIPVNGQSRHVIGYLQDFLFAPDRSRTLVKFLSGGERSRLLLAKLFTRPSNVLVLDEPTNDLDVETLELLESLLVDYKGTVLLVSHDRAFLNEVVTSTLAIEAEGLVKEYDGGYDDYLRQRPDDPKPTPQPTTVPSPKPPSETNPKSRKLTHKERRELEELPRKIETMESALRALHATMADPSFYRQDKNVLAETKTRLDTLQSDLAVAYDRWERLEAMS